MKQIALFLRLYKNKQPNTFRIKINVPWCSFFIHLKKSGMVSPKAKSKNKKKYPKNEQPTHYIKLYRQTIIN